MQLAGEYDVANSAIQAVTAVGTFASFLPARGAAEAAQRSAMAKIREFIQNQIRDKMNERWISLQLGQALLNNILNPKLACAALAECESRRNGNNTGTWRRTNAIGNVIRSCTWTNGWVQWYRSGAQLGGASSLPVIGGLFGEDVVWRIGENPLRTGRQGEIRPGGGLADTLLGR
jgi:hypothetical protein